VVETVSFSALAAFPGYIYIYIYIYILSLCFQVVETVSFSALAAFPGFNRSAPLGQSRPPSFNARVPPSGPLSQLQLPSLNREAPRSHSQPPSFGVREGQQSRVGGSGQQPIPEWRGGARSIHRV